MLSKDWMQNLIELISERVQNNYKSLSDPSLLTGSSGNLLFLSYLYNEKPSTELLNCIQDIIEYTIDLFNEQEESIQNYTYGGGLTGFYWTINHIYRNKLLLKESGMIKEIITKEIDYLIAKSLTEDFKSFNYDPLYGYIGKGIYFSSKRQSTFTTEITKGILNTLKNDRIRVSKSKITWVHLRSKYDFDSLENERLIVADCGQAHGVTGIISYLCVVIENFTCIKLKETAFTLLSSAMEWLLSQMVPTNLRYNNFFFKPTVNLLQQKKGIKNGGRLAWCYGDNIIAYTLYRASAILKEKKYKKIADEIIKHCWAVSVDNSGVLSPNGHKQFDPTLCHGTAGIAMIYESIYRYNKANQTINNIKKWKDLTIHYTEKYLKSSSLRSLSDNETEACDFLYGYSGIGLYLLTSKNSKKNWKSGLIIK